MPDQVRHDWRKNNLFVMRVKLREIPGRIYLRYILLNIPALVLIILALKVAQHWITVPLWLSLSIVLIWLIKDVILFPFVWRAYDWKGPGRSRSMVGKQGYTRERLAPSGYVLVQGELWKAEIADPDQPIESGKLVRVVKMEGLKLFVRPEEPEVSSQGYKLLRSKENYADSE
jgi:membrane-bound ClpP family serine protease